MISKNFKNDLSASIVVYFVAIPLCLGIALASGAPLFSGIIAGIVGGIVVGIASGSPLGVSGPAAGLAVIVATAISTLGSWNAFLLAVVISGMLQLALGYARAGFIAHFFPSSVIKGMLTGIGLLIILKQIPHILGYDKDSVGSISYFQTDGESTLSAIASSFHACALGAVIISACSLIILILWDTVLAKKHKVFQLLQGPIVVILVGVGLNQLFLTYLPSIALQGEHLVSLPIISSVKDFYQQFSYPNFSAITQLNVWKTAFVLAVVGSLETLLSVEATDKLDPYRRVTPTNRELKAQGLGNAISGLCGGLPITQVIVRSSTNITFGAKTKLSAILHGFLLLISVFTIAKALNMIPIASLAAVLIAVGYKLAKPELFKKIYQLGAEQYVPFLATIIGILTMDLLKGILAGIFFGIFYTLRHSYKNAYYMKDIITEENQHPVHHLVLAEEVSFFNKASIIKALESFPANSTVIIDCANSKSIAYDVAECIKNYKINAKLKNIKVETVNFIEPA